MPRTEHARASCQPARSKDALYRFYTFRGKTKSRILHRVQQVNIQREGPRTRENRRKGIKKVDPKAKQTDQV